MSIFADVNLTSKNSDRQGVDSNDRETRKIEAWLEMAESREGDVEATLPFFLEIPTIVFQDEIIKFG
jgi:hypothetical protein